MVEKLFLEALGAVAIGGAQSNRGRGGSSG